MKPMQPQKKIKDSKSLNFSYKSSKTQHIPESPVQQQITLSSKQPRQVIKISKDNLQFPLSANATSHLSGINGVLNQIQVTASTSQLLPQKGQKQSSSTRNKTGKKISFEGNLNNHQLIQAMGLAIQNDYANNPSIDFRSIQKSILQNQTTGLGLIGHKKGQLNQVDTLNYLHAFEESNQNLSSSIENLQNHKDSTQFNSSNLKNSSTNNFEQIIPFQILPPGTAEGRGEIQKYLTNLQRSNLNGFSSSNTQISQSLIQIDKNQDFSGKINPSILNVQKLNQVQQSKSVGKSGKPAQIQAKFIVSDSIKQEGILKPQSLRPTNYNQMKLKNRTQQPDESVGQRIQKDNSGRRNVQGQFNTDNRQLVNMIVNPNRVGVQSDQQSLQRINLNETHNLHKNLQGQNLVSLQHNIQSEANHNQMSNLFSNLSVARQGSKVQQQKGSQQHPKKTSFKKGSKEGNARNSFQVEKSDLLNIQLAQRYENTSQQLQTQKINNSRIMENDQIGIKETAISKIVDPKLIHLLGSSSATNKVKKHFEFEFKHQGQNTKTQVEQNNLASQTIKNGGRLNPNQSELTKINTLKGSLPTDIVPNSKSELGKFIHKEAPKPKHQGYFQEMLEQVQRPTISRIQLGDQNDQVIMNVHTGPLGTDLQRTRQVQAIQSRMQSNGFDQLSVDPEKLNNLPQTQKNQNLVVESGNFKMFTAQRKPRSPVKPKQLEQGESSSQNVGRINIPITNLGVIPVRNQKVPEVGINIQDPQIDKKVGGGNKKQSVEQLNSQFVIEINSLQKGPSQVKQSGRNKTAATKKSGKDVNDNTKTESLTSLSNPNYFSQLNNSVEDIKKTASLQKQGVKNLKQKDGKGIQSHFLDNQDSTGNNQYNSNFNQTHLINVDQLKSIFNFSQPDTKATQKVANQTQLVSITEVKESLPVKEQNPQPKITIKRSALEQVKKKITGNPQVFKGIQNEDQDQSTNSNANQQTVTETRKPNSGKQSNIQTINWNGSNEMQNNCDNYEKQLREMETQIQMNQIKLRNELKQIQNGQRQDIGEMGMDVESQEYMNDEQFQMSIGQIDQKRGPSFNQRSIAKKSVKSNNLTNKTAVPVGENVANLFNKVYSSKNSRIQSVESTSMNGGSQLRASSQKRKGKGANGSKMRVSNNRSSVGSSKGRSKNQRRHQEDILIEVDSMHPNNLLIDSSLGFASAVQSFGMKKAVTTKHQQSKVRTQNVQNLLKEAKRENLLDSTDFGVQLDDFDVGKKQKLFNLTGNQNLKSQLKDFSLQQQRLNIQLGISPKNMHDKQVQNSKPITDFQSKLDRNMNVMNQAQIIRKQSNNTQLPLYQNKPIQTATEQNFLKQIQDRKNSQSNNQNSQQSPPGGVNRMKQQRQSNRPQVKMIDLNSTGQKLTINTIPNQLMYLDKNSTQAFAPGFQNTFLLTLHSGKSPSSAKNTRPSNQTNIISQFNFNPPLPEQKQESKQRYSVGIKTNPQNQDSSLNNQKKFDSQLSLVWQNQQTQQEQSQPLTHQMKKSDIIFNSQISIIDLSEQNIQSKSNLIPKENSFDPSVIPTTNVAPILLNNFVNEETKIESKKVQEETLKLPTSGAKVLKYYLKKTELTEYEKGEILDFKNCYFLGLEAEKIKGCKQKEYNFGYDDSKGDYKVVLRDHLAYRFEVVDFLGKGSFGQALKCVDHKTGEIVAVKIIRNKKKLEHQAGVELKILLHLRDKDPDDSNNIIRIKDFSMFRKHLIISFELFSINLYEFIKNNNFEGVSLNLIRRFAIQILQALKYLREENLIHCDLKPENILLKSPDKSGIKVIDFGSSCFAHERIYTYIQSRFYRAPEIILGIPYTSAIDMWSFGCILTELFTGVPLFPGESEKEQLSLIMEIIGLPDDYLLTQSLRKREFFNEETNQPYLTSDSHNNLRIPGSKQLGDILMCQSDSFIDFISRCLEWDPEKRISPFEALMHQWIIEGLPEQVLVHHKKMLGIYDSENEEGLRASETEEELEEQFQVATDDASDEVDGNEGHAYHIVDSCE